MDLDDFQINKDLTLKDALYLIDKNEHGVIFVTASKREVIGIATDGDIRRYLLKGGKIGDQVENCINKNYLWRDADETRENLLKCLDDGIKIIPLLDNKKRLIKVITPKYFPLNSESKYYSRARAPTRISFGGGGSDLTYYFSENLGAVINATISVYAHATLKKRNDFEIHVSSFDLKKKKKYKNLKIFLNSEDEFELVRSILKLVKPSFGFELYLQSDFPFKSGLGGSSSITAAVLGCFNEFRLDRWDHHEMAEIAFQAERIELSVAGGWQDQYASIFGGFNFIEFTSQENLVHPLRLQKDICLELEESLILCYTGITHDSGEIHENQKKVMQKKNLKYLSEENVKLCYELKSSLLRGNLVEFGKLMNNAWKLKQSFSPKISSQNLESIFSLAMKNGALGGKLLGAGGGGYFIFFVPPTKRNQLLMALDENHLTVLPFKFDQRGLESWTVRDK